MIRKPWRLPTWAANCSTGQPSSSTLVRQRVDRVLVGKRHKDGNQNVEVLLNDPKKRKRKFALSLLGEL